MADSTFYIIGGVIVTVGSAEIKNVQKKETSPSKYIRPIMGGFLMGSFLFAIDMIDSRLARLFSVLITLTALLMNGGALATAMNSLLNRK